MSLVLRKGLLRVAKYDHRIRFCLLVKYAKEEDMLNLLLDIPNKPVGMQKFAYDSLKFA